MTSATTPNSLKRRSEAKRLTALMEIQTPFTYLRLGDGELQLLLEWQEGQTPTPSRSTASTLFDAYSINGLREQDYSRLRDSFERCSYLDTFERVRYSAENFHRLKLKRNSNQTRSPNADLSQIFYEWTFLELPAYVARHRCVIAGAEGPLLRALLSDPRYRKSIGHFWLNPGNITCVGIRNNGRNYWNALPEIKNDLVSALKDSKADTLFLSLASGAKILCQEISEDLGIRCFDLGAMLLGLTYSATPGNSVARNSHNPFFFRVPFDIYLDALQRASPDLLICDLVTKAQAQLCLELLRKKIMYSFVPEIKDHRNFDPSAENLYHFRCSEREYYRRFGPFLTGSTEGRKLADNFDTWCRERGLGAYGSVTRSAVLMWSQLVNASGLGRVDVPAARYFNFPVRMVRKTKYLLLHPLEKATHIVNVIMDAWRILKLSDLPHGWKRDLARAVLRLHIPDAGKLPNPVNLLGYRVSYFHPEHVRLFFREIFLERSYFFCADHEPSLILDCGSNIGMSILLFKKMYPQARILGFEPDPDTFRILQQNIDQNRLKDVTLYQCALSGAEATIGFYVNAEKSGSPAMSMHKERTNGKRISVPGRKLSSFISEEVDLLKIDVEGAEEAIVSELAASGKLQLIKRIHLEYHHHILPGSDRLSRLLSLLESSGFGYQMRAESEPWGIPQQFQDIGIFFYRKDYKTVGNSQTDLQRQFDGTAHR
jgi:FkbM family methyltransferase